MKRAFYLLSLLLPIMALQLCFQSSSYACEHSMAKTKKKLLKTTIADAREDYYDLKYTKLSIAMNNTNTNIAGSVVYNAVVSNALMNEYVFVVIILIIFLEPFVP